MKNINVLFKNVYGFEPNGSEQLEVFVECLKERLSYSEKAYVRDNYNVDLFKDEDYEQRIKKLMHHPLCYEDVIGHKDEINEIYKQFNDQDIISISYIQRNYSKGYVTAKKIVDELLSRGLIVPVTDTTYKVKR